MPTYAYRCARCDADFEVFQSISEPPLTVCPVGHAGVERRISGGAGVIFRGSGFYATDYRKPDYVARARGDTASAGAPEHAAKGTRS